ncbi:ectonucleotide pyrophosphatase/phosphodiesterase family member 3 [Anguilla anguilla]|uniref:ectonucleotide pyrophosphatase/phosphodiesterase family member 3 n=1 Tax=Anguilla anguilla TaxID=7936 RepID=UPI0015B15FCE|nr:ectonucleotide pyrophosphatase/phosphodiesterase family member 3 [Anguilla anguilla]
MGIGKNISPRKKLIIIGLLAVCIVTIILGLGLGLGLDNCDKKDLPISCRQRCYEPYDNEYTGCRCDVLCVHSNSCCYDFQDTCLQPTEQWECTKLRCGEKRLSNSKCHCSDDCLGSGDCCTNFKSVCQGETQWVDDTCDEIAAPKCPAGFSRQPLLLISLDGFRAEYLSTWSQLIPVLDKLKNCGTHAPYMQAVFPSLTFPNHYTIATGLFSESHGLVDNSMYDPVFNASFSLSNSEKSNPRWYQGQPIWLTAMYQGLKSGTFFWPGSDVKVNGSFPDIYMDYNGKTPFEERVFTVLRWLRLPDKERPDFFTLYLEEPDKSGHNDGPVSGRVILAIQEVDRIIGQLMNGLKQMGLHQCINIIIVADHGMEDTSCDRVEYLQNMIGDVRDLYVYQGAFGRIRSIDTHLQLDSASLVANMTCTKPDQQIKPYLKPHLPKRFHYAANRRIEDVNVLVNAKWLFARYKGSLSYCAGGTHGYDNDIESMQAMFLSFGPKFLYKTQVDPFSNIELYNLMCDVLEITPAPNNGSHGSLNHLLRRPWHMPSFPVEKTPPGHCPLITLVLVDQLGCSCPDQIESTLNNRLNLTSSEVLTSEKKHMLFGRPRMLRPGENYCLLYQHGFISAYSKSSLMPAWNSYTVDKPDSLTPLPEVIPTCLRADVRIPGDSSPRCDQYAQAGNLTRAFLYPPNLNITAIEQYDGLLISNVVPMYPQFKRIWDYFHTVLLMKYAWQYNGINVVSGPVFDYNYDGNFDSPDQIEQFVAGTRIPVPTHYFVVLSSCKNTSIPVGGCKEEMQTVSFLLPHRPTNSEVCNSQEAESQWVEDLVWFHQCRVRDVELLTGLDFYQDSNRTISELLQLKARPTAAIHRKN